jgi:hypothetical protein
LRVFLGERRWNLAILICASIYAKVSNQCIRYLLITVHQNTG